MEIFLPGKAETFSVREARAYLSNFVLELDRIPFTAAERTALTDRKLLGKLVDVRTRPAFLNHFAPLLVEAVRGLWGEGGGRCPVVGERKRIVELGCGSGTCAILFGLLGAQVTALDQDPVLVSAARRRLRFYQGVVANRRSQKSEVRTLKSEVRIPDSILPSVFRFLPSEGGPSAGRAGRWPVAGGQDVRFERADVFAFDYSRIAPIDGVYSLFAFNLMQPSLRLLDAITPHLALDARLVISDGNRDGLYNRLFRARRCLSPRQVGQALEERWQHVRLLSESFHAPVPQAVKRLAERTGFSRWLGVSYTLVAVKGE